VRVFFDVDFTILGQDGTLRPGTLELFSTLVDDGHQVYVWSGFGDRSKDVRRLGLDHLVTGYFRKPLSGLADGHEAWELPFRPDFVIDDHPGPVAFIGGYHISAYVDGTSSEDREMVAVYEAIKTAHRTGRAERSTR
jgi:hypothetical protein